MGRKSQVAAGIPVLAAALGIGNAATGSSLIADYAWPFQMQYGDSATFNVTGPATGNNPDWQGDAFLGSVEMPTGEKFIHFAKPAAIGDIQFSGDQTKWLIRAGSNCSVGLSNVNHQLGQGDGNPGDVTEEDIEAFRQLALTALQNNNLNNYIDTHANTAQFTMTIDFGVNVKDNDEEPDEFGEILYFERGAGAGNSWMKIRAVDEAGNGLGPWLVLCPSETVQTTPMTTVYRSDQKVGTTSIDVSRLGVSEFRYLQVSNNVTTESAYTGGGDMSPDFKIMFVFTNTEQLAEIMFD